MKTKLSGGVTLVGSEGTVAIDRDALFCDAIERSSGFRYYFRPHIVSEEEHITRRNGRPYAEYYIPTIQVRVISP